MVGGGILGSSTKVDVEGALWAKFAQEADIRVGGDARIGSYLFNASLRAGGKVIVLGRGDGKARSLVGGLVWAGLGIESSSIGSPYNSATRPSVRRRFSPGKNGWKSCVVCIACARSGCMSTWKNWICRP